MVITKGGQGKVLKTNIQAGGLHSRLPVCKCRGGRVRSIAPVLKTGGSSDGPVGSNPTLYGRAGQLSVQKAL